MNQASVAKRMREMDKKMDLEPELRYAATSTTKQSLSSTDRHITHSEIWTNFFSLFVTKPKIFLFLCNKNYLFGHRKKFLKDTKGKILIVKGINEKITKKR